MGYKWKRARRSLKVFRNQDLFDIKKEELESLVHLDKEGYIDLYFGDESHFGLVPNVPYAWQSKENPILQPSLKSKRLTVFGLMNMKCSLFSKVITGSLDTIKLIGYIDEFAKTLKKRTVLVLDNAPIHRSKLFKSKIQEWEQLDLYIYFLPPYSPELNKIEILWRFIKYSWLPFEAYASFEKLEQGIANILDQVGKKYIINYL